MFKRPFFSIVIPTYNRAEDLQFALYCIFQQSFTNFEIVISDNCSVDETKLIVDTLQDKRIRYFRRKETVGNALNMKNGIDLAKGEYVVLHSDDDFFIYSNTLQNVYDEITKNGIGYVRLNYMSLALDRKEIFSYKVNKPFAKNVYLRSGLGNKEIASFIVDSDPYFITGIIFKNSFPSNIDMVDSDPAPWVDILFYNIKHFGACFIKKQHILARWSRRKIEKNETHHIFTLVGGKLRAENYFSVVKKKLSMEEYGNFLHNELMLLYVKLFPVIKVHVGDKIMLQMAARIRSLDQRMNKSITYWTYLIGSFLIPRVFLIFIRSTVLYLISKYARVNNYNQIKFILKKMEQKFFDSRENVLKRNDPLFNF